MTLHQFKTAVSPATILEQPRLPEECSAGPREFFLGSGEKDLETPRRQRLPVAAPHAQRGQGGVLEVVAQPQNLPLQVLDRLEGIASLGAGRYRQAVKTALLLKDDAGAHDPGHFGMVPRPLDIGYEHAAGGEESRDSPYNNSCNCPFARQSLQCSSW